MGNNESYQTLFVGHECILSDDPCGLPKLAPNAPWFCRLIRAYRKLLAPNPHLAITKRNFRNISQITAEVRRHAKGKYFYIIHPFSTIELIREIVFIFILLWEVFGTTVIAAFNWVKDSDEIDQPYEYVVGKRFFMCLECLWILSCMFTGYKSNQHVVLEHPKILMWYCLTFLIPDCITVILPLGNLPEYAHCLNFIMVFRCSTMLKYIRRFLEDWRVPLEIRTMIIIIIETVFLIHSLSLLFYMIPKMLSDGKEMLWIWNIGFNNNFPISLRYANIFLLIGHYFLGWPDDGKPDTAWEKLILVIAMILGRLWKMVILASIIRVISISSQSESKYEEYLKQLDTFISYSGLPKEMRNRIFKFYSYKYQHHIFDEKRIFNALSVQLKQQVMLYRARSVMNKVAIFKIIPVSMAAAIIAKCKVLVFLNNDVVIKHGDISDIFYFISNGVLAVYTSDFKYEIVHLTDGEDIGIKGLLGTGPVYFNHNYVSVGTTEIYMIHVKEFKDLVFNLEVDIGDFFSKRLEERRILWDKLLKIAMSVGVNLKTELQHNRVLERPRVRTRFFDRD